MLDLEEFADGAEVLREGDSGDWLGVVLEGEGVVEKRIDGDGDVVEVIAMVSRGDVIGEMAFASGNVWFGPACLREGYAKWTYGGRVGYGVHEHGYVERND